MHTALSHPYYTEHASAASGRDSVLFWLRVCPWPTHSSKSFLQLRLTCVPTLHSLVLTWSLKRLPNAPSHRRLSPLSAPTFSLGIMNLDYTEAPCVCVCVCVLDFHSCMRAFSACSEQELLLCVAFLRGLLRSPGSQHTGFGSFGAGA